MAILVDAPVWPYRDRLWAHLISDVSFAELHDFARRLALPERGFHRDHYDLPARRLVLHLPTGWPWETAWTQMAKTAREGPPLAA
ncbi:hypothetical protein BH20ACT9_BH20ACT9_10730 [soil metagenome]